MIFKKNGSDSDVIKKETENKILENNSNKMFQSTNFNGFNTARGGFFKKDSNFPIQNNFNNIESMAVSKLKLMNTDSPIKLQRNKNNEINRYKDYYENEENQSNEIKIDFDNNRNSIAKQNSDDRLNTNNSIGRGYNTEEESISPQLTK